jgi:hypothetical protein
MWKPIVAQETVFVISTAFKTTVKVKKEERVQQINITAFIKCLDYQGIIISCGKSRLKIYIHFKNYKTPFRIIHKTKPLTYNYVRGFYITRWLVLIAHTMLHNSAQRDNCLKLRWTQVIDKQNNNAQVQANMNSS